MAKILKTSAGKILSLSTGKIAITPLDIKVIPGGTATGVTITEYPSSTQEVYKQELIASGEYTAEELANATVLNIQGTTVGTVILNVSKLGNVGDTIKLMHRKSNNTWETLFSGEIPANKRVTITLTEFSPIVGCKWAPPNPLCFTATQGTGRINFKKNGSSWTNTPVLEYSTDLVNWTSYTFGNTVYLDKNVPTYFRGNNSSFSESSTNYINATTEYSSSEVQVSGSVMSLVNAVSTDTIPNTYCFYRLFYISDTRYAKIISAPLLPATTLKNYCYSNMFENCAGLKAAPALPATSLADSCYNYMFDGCTGMLTPPPILPATTAKQYCYNGMFEDCESLTSAPVISLTSMALQCCMNMFLNCSDIVTPPVLSCTDLAQNCYCAMFRGCTSLTSSPALPATYLAKYCYNGMFMGCTSLTTIGTMSTMSADMATGAMSGMFQGCTSLETSAPLSLRYVYQEVCESMYNGCTSLTTVSPIIVSDWTSGYKLFKGMFAGCTSLESVQTNLLPCTSLYESIYESMFKDCSSLVTPPKLPATVLAKSCYYQMFMNCTSLTTVPALPANGSSGSVTNSYGYMFYGCTNLHIADATSASGDIAWQIPSSSTAQSSFSMTSMFYGCAGTRANNNLSISTFNSKTYYVANQPIS